MLPLIVLPFLCLFFYVYQMGFAKEEAPGQEGDPLQGQIADVSEDVKNRALSDKLAAYREQYRRGDGYTAIGQLQEERAEQFRFNEMYNEEEKRRLDSIEPALKNQRPFSNNGDSENDDEDRALQKALS